jgi:hypothetical protein
MRLLDGRSDRLDMREVQVAAAVASMEIVFVTVEVASTVHQGVSKARFGSRGLRTALAEATLSNPQLSLCWARIVSVELQVGQVVL